MSAFEWILVGGLIMFFFFALLGTDDEEQKITDDKSLNDWRRRAFINDTDDDIVESADLIAIDFETATQKRSSACAVAVVFVEGFEIIGSYHQLIKPPGNRYCDVNISIHGIRPEDTKNAPEFRKVWDVALKEIIYSGATIVAHYARFDMDVLRKSLREYDIEVPYIPAQCTVEISKEMFPGLRNYKLPTVARYIGVPLQHHDPVSDATVAAQIVLEWRQQNKETVLKEKRIKSFVKKQEKILPKIEENLSKAKALEKDNSSMAAIMYFDVIKTIQAIMIDPEVDEDNL